MRVPAKDARQEGASWRPGITRRELLRLSAGAAGALALAPLAGCGPQDAAGALPVTSGVSGGGSSARPVRLLSTQLAPEHEAHALRSAVLPGFDREVDFVAEQPSAFYDRASADAPEVAVLGGTHGDLAALVERGLLADVRGLVEELGDRAFDERFLAMARYGRDGLYFVPWMRATYRMVARREALDYLPEGADLKDLTFDDIRQWSDTIVRATGVAPLGLPAAEGGLVHRFVQGYAYPSFTGALNTAFAGADAVAMWQATRAMCHYADAAALGYAFLHEPLVQGNVWIGWDHDARLVDALHAYPEEFVTLAAPRGPKGRGYMEVVAGLAIPRNSTDPEGARALIEYLTRHDVTAAMQAETGFAPPTSAGGGEPGTGKRGGLEPIAPDGDPSAVRSVLPVGLGQHVAAYDDVFRRTYARIIVGGMDIKQVLEAEAPRLQQVLEGAGASCWTPDDPSGSGVCRVA